MPYGFGFESSVRTGPHPHRSDSESAIGADGIEQNLAAARKTVEADEADVELAKLQFSRADDLMKKGAGTIEARDQTNATLKRSNAALERDQALEKSAERQVDLAKANVRNAKEALKLARIDRKKYAGKDADEKEILDLKIEQAELSLATTKRLCRARAASAARTVKQSSKFCYLAGAPLHKAQVLDQSGAMARLARNPVLTH